MCGRRPLPAPAYPEAATHPLRTGALWWQNSWVPRLLATLPTTLGHLPPEGVTAAVPVVPPRPTRQASLAHALTSHLSEAPRPLPPAAAWERARAVVCARGSGGSSEPVWGIRVQLPGGVRSVVSGSVCPTTALRGPASGQRQQLPPCAPATLSEVLQGSGGETRECSCKFHVTRVGVTWNDPRPCGKHVPITGQSCGYHVAFT